MLRESKMPLKIQSKNDKMDGARGKTLSPKKGAKIQSKPTRSQPYYESNFLSHKTLEKADDMYYYSFC